MYESNEYPSGDETMTRTFHFPRPFVTTRIRIDQVEEDLLSEKYKIKRISDELNQTFDDMINMAG